MKRVVSLVALPCVLAMGCGGEGDLTIDQRATGGGSGGAHSSGSTGGSGGSSAAGKGGAGGAQAGAGAAGAAGQGGSAIKPKRTVETRSPFGNLSNPKNLVADGDFEMTGRQAQMPWIVFGDSGQQTLNFETGGRCRSGVRCAAVGGLGATEEYIGWVVSPKEDKIAVSLWAKPYSGVCADLAASLVDSDSADFGADLASETEAPGADGWCRFSGVGPNMAARAPVVYLSVDASKQRVLVDDVQVTAAPASAKKGIAPSPGLIAGPPRPEVAARVAFIADVLRKTRRYGLNPSLPFETTKPRPQD